MIRLLLLSALLITLSGCGETTEVDVTIIKLVTEDPKSNWGCVSTDIRTVYKSADGHINYLCGDYGTVGDTFKMFWTTGAFDPSYNGFKLVH